MHSKQFLELMCSTQGASGYECRVAHVVEEGFGRYCDEVRKDKLGNVIALKSGCHEPPRPRIMLAAHMDEVALVVTKIEESGFLRFIHPGIDRRTLPAAEVVVHGRRDLPGLICVMPPHLLKPEDRQKSYKTDDLSISVGLSYEQVKEVVSVGDTVTMMRQFTELQNRNVAAKALDDRAGVAVIYECLSELSKMKHEADVFACATVQEEPGLRGAIVAAYGIVPDLAVAIDVGFGDQPGVPESRQLTLDKGPGIALGPNVHPKLFESLKRCAEEYSVAYQLDVTPGRSGTDAWAIQVSREGVPTAILSIPTRNMHTSVEITNLDDIKRAARLLARFISSVDRAYVEGLVW